MQALESFGLTTKNSLQQQLQLPTVLLQLCIQSLVGSHSLISMEIKSTIKNKFCNKPDCSRKSGPCVQNIALHSPIQTCQITCLDSRGYLTLGYVFLSGLQMMLYITLVGTVKSIGDLDCYRLAKQEDDQVIASANIRVI